MLPPLLPLLVLPGPPLFLPPLPRVSAAGKVFMFVLALALERTLVDDGPEDVPARRGLGAISVITLCYVYVRLSLVR